MRRIIITVAVFLAVVIIVSAAIYLRGKATAFVFDTSGSMQEQGFFHTAKQSILGDLMGIGRWDVRYIVPFAENDGAIMRMTYEDRYSFPSLERYMKGLTAQGQFTNFDEGVDAGIVELSKESRWLSKTLVLITDALSDPGPDHDLMSPEQLSVRVPDDIRFFIVDISNRKYPQLSEKWIGWFAGYTMPGSSFMIIPIEHGRLEELLKMLSGRDICMLPWYPYSLYAVIGMLAASIGCMIFFMKRKDGREDLFTGEEIANHEPEHRNGMIHVQVGGVDRRFGTPVKLSIGSGKRDDFRVKGARRHELILLIADGKEKFRHRKGMFGKLKGHIYRSRSFTLKNGISVIVRIGDNDRILHRYLKGV